MRVSELRGEPNLAEEALGPQRAGHFGPEHFERDQARLLEIPREVDRRHPTPAQLALERVAGGEGVAEHERRETHGTTEEGVPGICGPGPGPASTASRRPSVLWAGQLLEGRVV